MQYHETLRMVFKAAGQGAVAAVEGVMSKISGSLRGAGKLLKKGIRKLRKKSKPEKTTRGSNGQFQKRV